MTNREKMFLDYKRELCAIDGTDLPDPVEAYLDSCNFFQTDRDSKWIAVTDEAGEEVGFLVVLSGRHVAEGVDYFIEDVYILPEYRRKGIMTKVASEFIDNHDGVYAMEIIDRNEAAHKFWGKIVDGRWVGEPKRVHELYQEYAFDTRKERAR